LGQNFLTGEIPSSIGNLIELSDLNILNNHLEGELPPELWTLTNLSTVQINHNQFEGELPPEIGNINFEMLWLDNNEFTFLPESICNLGDMLYDSFDTEEGIIYYFTSGNNSICDQIPTCLETSVGFNWGLNFEIPGLEYQPQNCEECPELNGDTNNDNEVNILDIMIVVNFILSDTYDDCSDLNGDESIDILDVVLMVDYILGT